MLPEGSEAVERQTVSGWCTPEVWAVRNQAWNWVNGEGESWCRSRVPFRYWSAWAELFWPAGATGGGGVSCASDRLGVEIRWGGEMYWSGMKGGACTGGIQINLSFACC